MKWRQSLEDIGEMLNTLVKAACILLLTVMVVAVTLQIFSRYILPKPLPWTEEVARFCMVWLCFLGSSCLIRTWENTGVTFFLDMFPPRIKFGVDIAIKITMLLFVAGLFWLAATQLPRISLNEKSPALMMSMLIPKSSIIFGFLVIAVQLLLVIVEAFFTREEQNNG
ncbi:MAG: TRAP transporter small permease [Planctomycetaceae bacterium]|nr:TRAP transporter small permease [Planctomycetaceae bacterium]